MRPPRDRKPPYGFRRLHNRDSVLYDGTTYTFENVLLARREDMYTYSPSCSVDFSCGITDHCDGSPDEREYVEREYYRKRVGY